MAKKIFLLNSLTQTVIIIKNRMKILVTGAKGFLGRNVIAQLQNIKSEKAKNYGNIKISEIFEYDLDSDLQDLDNYCRHTDFVFHFAGVNRPLDKKEFHKENVDFFVKILNTLNNYNNKCPVMLSSSIQASLEGRFEGSEYGKSKLEGEKLLFEYSQKNGIKALVYRFPNAFGKWCRPNYNSAVATFCYNISHDLPIRVDDPKTILELVYIDDLVDEMIAALKGEEHRCDINGLAVTPNNEGMYCYVPTTHKVSLGEIVDLLKGFYNQQESLIIPHIPENSFAKKLYSTYISYLPKEKISFPLKMNVDERGSFTELLKTLGNGQVSINISKPGVTKGQHWHNTKWEFFIVVSGHGLIQQRRIGSDEVLNFEVSGDKIEAVHMLPGYTHNIINLSDTEDLVTVMWCNECFNPQKPDTYSEKV